MALLELHQVCKDYVQGKEPVRVLHDIDLSIESGEYLAIMGPSGSGKTTLMNLIGCLDTLTSGSYTLNGQQVDKMTDNQLAELRNKYIGFVFQSFYLLPKLTAVDNVALPLLYAGVPLKERRAKAEKVLQAVGMGERLKFYPNQLSGGQCQRVAIARAIVTNPAILLADEPTGALDTKSGEQIMDIFRALSRGGMTILMITHEPSIAACADKTYHILDGQLHHEAYDPRANEDAPLADFDEMGGIYEELLQNSEENAFFPENPAEDLAPEAAPEEEVHMDAFEAVFGQPRSVAEEMIRTAAERNAEEELPLSEDETAEEAPPQSEDENTEEGEEPNET